MSRIKPWILGGCAASSLFALGASQPVAPRPGHFSVTISPAVEGGSFGEGHRTHQGVPIVPFSVYHPEAASPPRDAIAVAGEAP